MDVNFEHYRLFYNVAKSGSFTKAAEQLYISQPAITQAIKKLEDSLGGTLFYRNVKGISLTEEGENLYNFIENSIETLDNAQKRFEQYKSLEKGKIVIRGTRTVMEQILVKPVIKFMKDYPNINIDILNGGHMDALKDLSEGKIDMAFFNLPVSYDYKNIQVVEVTNKEMVFVMSKEYQKENNVKIENVEDLYKYNLIMPRKGTKYRQMLDDVLDKEREYKYEMMSGRLRNKFVKANLGIAPLFKDGIQEELKNGELIEIKLNEKFKMSIGVGVLDNKRINFATKKLLEYVKNEN